MKTEDRLLKNAQVSEKAIERYLARKMDKVGGVALKFASCTQTGYPDRVCLFPSGLTAWIEIKSQGEKPRPLQEIRIKKLKRLGHLVLTVDCKEAVDSFVDWIMDHVKEP